MPGRNTVRVLYLAIQKQSRQRRKSKKDIAEAIIIGEEMRRSGQTD